MQTIVAKQGLLLGFYFLVYPQQNSESHLNNLLKTVCDYSLSRGVFNSFFDIMLSDDVGIFRWQIIFEIRTRLAEGMSTKLIMHKAALLLAIFFSIA